MSRDQYSTREMVDNKIELIYEAYSLDQQDLQLKKLLIQVLADLVDNLRDR